MVHAFVFLVFMTGDASFCQRDNTQLRKENKPGLIRGTAFHRKTAGLPVKCLFYGGGKSGLLCKLRVCPGFFFIWWKLGVSFKCPSIFISLGEQLVCGAVALFQEIGRCYLMKM
jgi:hypothetical protein